MQIVDFATAHIEQAMQIAKQNYEDERHHVSALPPIVTVPDLAPYVENGFGVAAFEGETFLCKMEDYAHVMGAFCLPEHRGKGLHQKLLYLMIQNLNAQGYTRFGVDFESINAECTSATLLIMTAMSFSNTGSLYRFSYTFILHGIRIAANHHQ